MKHSSFATRLNADLIEENYKLWLDRPDSLDQDWQSFFEGFELARNGGVGPGLTETTVASRGIPDTVTDAKKQTRVVGALYAYRSIGHTQAMINPLSKEVVPNPRLTLDRLGLSKEDLDDAYDTGNYLGGVRMEVGELLDRLQRTYCGSIGAEYIHIQETAKRRWIQARLEPNCAEPVFSEEEKVWVYRKLAAAEDFERFLHSRFVGQKRFSLEGAESLMVALDTILQNTSNFGVSEIVMGMAHRGRLNVLANFLGKSLEYIFREFSESHVPDGVHGDGDVKYHLGYQNEVKTKDGHPVKIILAPNPSHLEAVNSVVEGMARARQRIIGDLERKSVLPLLLHGDAAFAGQGVVAEVLNFSKLKGYRTGGTVHLVVNNQIGFTTDPTDARSSRYCTDVAKMIESPIFHVNGDDPLAVAMITQLAFEYRQEFSEDVFIDIYCYRKHGHNESDEPAFTQPVLYKKIAEMESARQKLRRQFLETGILDGKAAKAMDGESEEVFEAAIKKAKAADQNSEKTSVFDESDAVFQPDYRFDDIPTQVDRKTLEHVAAVLTKSLDNFNLNPKIERQMKAKRKAFENDSGIDWAFAELMAFGSLLMEGTPVRLSGQDSERGTFSQRHAAFYDMRTRERYVPLLHLSPDQAQFCVHNSLLSEAAVLGFDFGYSLEYPDMLSIWEAQFGDFANGAQVVIDQFIAASESKWQRLSGIVLLLPHGYEGQGPEHSSARMERFLQLAAEDNIQVCNLTTPSQYFHVLRRQMKREFRKPLVVMSPKSLLRHRKAVSKISDFTDAVFQSILDDPQPPEEETRRVILCSGKVYYDLLNEREAAEIKDTAIIRLEQLYPFNEELLTRVFSSYASAKDIVWCQEEPRNMGAWGFVAPRLRNVLDRRIRYAGRKHAASPATGFLAVHKQEQQSLIRDALGIRRT